MLNLAQHIKYIHSGNEAYVLKLCENETIINIAEVVLLNTAPNIIRKLELIGKVIIDKNSTIRNNILKANKSIKVNAISISYVQPTNSKELEDILTSFKNDESVGYVCTSESQFPVIFLLQCLRPNVNIDLGEFIVEFMSFANESYFRDRGTLNTDRFEMLIEHCKDNLIKYADYNSLVYKGSLERVLYGEPIVPAYFTSERVVDYPGWREAIVYASSLAIKKKEAKINLKDFIGGKC